MRLSNVCLEKSSVSAFGVKCWSGSSKARPDRTHDGDRAELHRGLATQSLADRVFCLAGAGRTWTVTVPPIGPSTRIRRSAGSARPPRLIGNLTVREMETHPGDRLLDRLQKLGSLSAPFTWPGCRRGRRLGY